MSRRAMALWFPGNADAGGKMPIWPLCVAGVWVIAHLIVCIVMPRAKRMWHGLVPWFLIGLSGLCAILLVWRTWLPIASAVFGELGEHP